MTTTTAPAAASSGQTWRSRLLSAVGAQNLSLLIALAVLVVIFGWFRADVFFTGRNLVNIGLAITILGILAMIKGYRSFRFGEEVEYLDREARKAVKKGEGFSVTSLLGEGISMNKEVKQWLE